MGILGLALRKEDWEIQSVAALLESRLRIMQRNPEHILRNHRRVLDRPSEPLRQSPEREVRPHRVRGELVPVPSRDCHEHGIQETHGGRHAELGDVLQLWSRDAEGSPGRHPPEVVEGS